jgi:CHAT domain-containing protein
MSRYRLNLWKWVFCPARQCVLISPPPWVILSACNTAAGSNTGAEALSGLARAFFYAGARALLVSHWSVVSTAAVKLTTGAVAELKAHPDIGKAAALRRSMAAVLEGGAEFEAHPAYWAPFVIVGEAGQ